MIRKIISIDKGKCSIKASELAGTDETCSC